MKSLHWISEENAPKPSPVRALTDYERDEFLNANARASLHRINRNQRITWNHESATLTIEALLCALDTLAAQATSATQKPPTLRDRIAAAIASCEGVCLDDPIDQRHLTRVIAEALEPYFQLHAAALGLHEDGRCNEALDEALDALEAPL